jgi:hypothetical protein
MCLVAHEDGWSVIHQRVRCAHCHTWSDALLVWAAGDCCPSCNAPLGVQPTRAMQPTRAPDELSDKPPRRGPGRFSKPPPGRMPLPNAAQLSERR